MHQYNFTMYQYLYEVSVESNLENIWYIAEIYQAFVNIKSMIAWKGFISRKKQVS